MKNLRILLFLQIIFLASCIGEDKSPRGDDYVVVGDGVPEFTVPQTNSVTGGAAVASPAVFIGKKSLLVFFVATCPDCKRELPFVQYALEQLPGLQVIAIGRDETRDRVTALWTEKAFDIPAYIDPGKVIFNKFASATVPRIYLIDEQAKVVWMAVEDLGYGEFEDAKGNEFVALIKNKLNL